ncbi:myelin-oligodendrocyte glycoprotein-like isoform X2 [Alligator sinensis]|uniref:Myelin-oligodendrocyte glycoprotein-like isoform X2 n=1 Tax=Alligator sinensis TaxID=38654 RepID=A0A3Q0HFL2_ALLSI|nr:myelin-oligodendrocyte glycoprotein-like isoform X2 [Alligator sinensis]
MKMPVSAVLAGIVLACLPALTGAGFAVTHARAGADVLLRCHVQRPRGFSLLDVTINWQQPGAVVHSFYKGTTHPEHQGERYQGRTQLFPAEFPKGNTSLLLRGVTPSDSGNYSCYAVLGANTPLTACTVELQVTVLFLFKAESGLDSRLGAAGMFIVLVPLLLLLSFLMCKDKHRQALLREKRKKYKPLCSHASISFLNLTCLASLVSTLHTINHPCCPPLAHL